MSETIEGRLTLQAIVETALNRYRDGDWLQLAASPLAHTLLVEGYFLAGEPLGDDVRARAMEVVLRWAVAKLRPAGAHNWFANAWRHYNIVHSFYLQGWRVADVAEQMAITEQTFYNWRPAAIATLAHIIAQECQVPRDAERRRELAMRVRYESQSAESQQLLRALSIFPQQATIPIQWLTQLMDVTSLPTRLRTLREAYLVEQPTPHQIRLHPTIHPYLYLWLTQRERQQWHQQAGECYRNAHAIVEAVHQWRAAGKFVRAAQLIVTHQETLFDQAQVRALYDVLRLFDPAELQQHPNLWAQIKIVTGRVTEYLEDLDSALREYGIALSAPLLTTKVEAYQRRARLFQRIDLDECLTHYAVCIELLKDTRLENGGLSAELLTHLTQMHIDRAWIFIQERPDNQRAVAELHRAEAFAPQHDSLTRSNLYNAWAGLVYHQGDLRRAIDYRLKAWVAACTTQNNDAMMKTAYNLGQGFMWLGEYDRALDYFAKSQALAEKADNLQMQGVIHKGIGGCCFLQGDVTAAIRHYQQAYQIWQDTKNPNYRANSCYDLAEAYAVAGVWHTARRFYDEGLRLVRSLDHQRLLQEYTDLAQQYPSLKVTLNQRQQQALHHARTHNSIATGEYMTLLSVSKRKALADLKQMVVFGVLEKRGSGRSVRYYATK